MILMVRKNHPRIPILALTLMTSTLTRTFSSKLRRSISLEAKWSKRIQSIHRLLTASEELLALRETSME